MKIRRASDRRGSAMILALVAFLFMAGIGAAIFSLSLAGQKTTMAAAFGDGAYHVAEAGIDDALNKMRGWLVDPDNSKADYAVIGTITYDKDGNKVNEVKGDLRGGWYYVTINPPVELDNTDIEYTITAIGFLAGETRGITTVVKASPKEGTPVPGLFGDVYLDTGGTINTDGYKAVDDNGNKLGYKPTNLLSDGKTLAQNMTGNVGSNGNVDVSGNSIIYGNATPGPGQTVTGGGKVYGSSAANSETVDLAPTDMTIPSNVTVTSKGNITGSTTLGTAGQTTYISATSVSPNGKSIVSIKGNVVMYVSGDFVFTGQTKLNIAAGATLTIYQNSANGTAKFQVNGSSVVNTDQTPSSLTMYSNTANGTLNGDAAFYGTVYAPTTAMKIAGTSGLFGATVAKSIDIQGTPYFHYDESLQAKTSVTVQLAVKSLNQFVPDKTYSTY